MSKYQVKDKDTVDLLDCKTNKKIINCTQPRGDEFANNKPADNESIQLINVRKSDIRFGEKGLALQWDVMPESRQVKKFAQAFVQYASAIAVALETGKDAVVYCKNGRSRSPSVVAAFYIIFRGMSLDETKKWFGEAYPAQRPDTATVSSNFPNLERFENVLQFLVKCLAEPTKIIQGFNLAGKLWIFFDIYAATPFVWQI